jgi:glucose-6-phosphate 1-dehydrogenase
LARKKLIPAVYDVGNRGLLPPGFVLLGFARRDWGDGDFEQLAKAAAKEHSRTEFREDVWRRIADCVRFVPGSFDDDDAFDELDKTLVELESTHGIAGNAAFYLSIPPAAFPQVLKQLDRTRMADNAARGGWRRVVVEKPFGHDLASSKDLNELVDTVFTPDDVFRIDHYLGKETVQNLLALRFANTLFEPVWNSNYVDSVQITMAEDVGIEGRAAFYDSAGAAPASGAHRHGRARELRLRVAPHREAQGAAGDLDPGRQSGLYGAGPVRAGLARRRARARLPRRGQHPT